MNRFSNVCATGIHLFSPFVHNRGSEYTFSVSPYARRPVSPSARPSARGSAHQSTRPHGYRSSSAPPSAFPSVRLPSVSPTVYRQRAVSSFVRQFVSSSVHSSVRPPQTSCSIRPLVRQPVRPSANTLTNVDSPNCISESDL